MNNLPIYEWEYKRIEEYKTRFMERADSLGKQGWELVNFSLCRGDGEWLQGVFKRPKIFGISISGDEKAL